MSIRGENMTVKANQDFIKMTLIFSLVVFTGMNMAQEPRVLTNPVVSEAVYPIIHNIDLADLPVERVWREGDPVREVPRRRTSTGLENYKAIPQIDPLLERQAMFEGTQTNRAFTAPTLNFPGLGYTGVNPPDTVGAVGKDHFIQSINGSGTRYIIYNKSDGSVAAGPFSLSSFAVCSGSGDPVVLYDHIAERWFLSEFGSGNSFCVLISQTSDPVNGGWFEYSFSTPAFPDYPKYGIWPDAYYVTTNETGCGAYALERAQMLIGGAARSVRFVVPDQAGFSFQTLTPSSCSGDINPPVGAPAYFMRHRDDEVHNAGSNNPAEDYLEIYEFHVDWVATANSTLTGPVNIAITEIDSDLNGLTAFACFPQPGTSTTLDPLREVIFFPLFYRRFSDHESMLGTLVTDVDGTDHGGIRWFELRKTSGAWSLYQEGTYAPDSDSRWMSSAAMDSKGNIAIGYNITSPTTYPGIRYVGRLASDPLGTLPAGENLIMAGTASNASNRYGDYSAMSVDPEDSCTFWFTGMFNVSSSWSTQVASMTFDSCLCTPLAAPSGVNATANGDNRIDVSWAAVPGAESYSVYRAVGSCPQNDWSLLISGVTGTSYSDTTVSGGVEYAYSVTSYDLQEDCESLHLDCASETTTGSCFLPPQFNGLVEIVDPQNAACSLVLNWDPGQAACAGAVTYNVYRGDTVDFTPDSGSLIASCLSATTYTDVNVLSYQTYYYIVRAEDSTGDGSGPCSSGNSDSNTVVMSGSASGPDTVFYEDDLETVNANWSIATLEGSPSYDWQLQDDVINAHSPTHVFFAEDVPTTQDHTVEFAQAVMIPAGSPARLSFFHKYNTESRYDGGVLEFSIDGGATWFDILAGNGGTISPNPARFIQGAYNQSSMSGGPLSGRAAWSGNSSGYLETLADLSDFTGEDLLLRWRMACDTSVNEDGWWMDDVKIFYGTACVNDTCTLFSASATSTGDYFVCSGAPTQLICSITGGSGNQVYDWSPSDSLSAANVQSPIASPTQTTTYSVTVTDGDCDDTATVTLHVYGVGPDFDYLEAWNTQTPVFDVNPNGKIDIMDYVTMENLCPD